MLKIEYLNSRHDVYDITVPVTENFYANNILVHNCQEITLPTTPQQFYNDPNGRISLCTLSALNWGRVKSPHDFEKPARLAVRFLDEILTYQNYPVQAAEIATKEFRPLGIGIINLAYFLAKNGLKYDDSALPLVDEYAEAYSYYLIKASVDLASEKGACTAVNKTKYNHGILPIDTYKKDIDELVPHQERMPWNDLREQMMKVGIRNSTLMALMPAECQSWENKVALADGRNLNFHELLEENNIDWKSIEEVGIPQRYHFKKPIDVMSRHGGEDKAVEFYYNGYSELIELEFEDGTSYKFTPNHQLLVNRDGHEIWLRVDMLREDDDVVCINA